MIDPFDIGLMQTAIQAHLPPMIRFKPLDQEPIRSPWPWVVSLAPIDRFGWTFTGSGPRGTANPPIGSPATSCS
jgi:hypothetical protein